MSIPYRTDIDGLRAVAVALVVLYHAEVPGFTGGYVGVDVFFVLSGFLITGVIVHQSDTSRFSLVGFYAGRARRLLPQSLFTLVATVAVGIWLLPATRATELIGDARAALLYVANWRYAEKSVAYVDVAVSDSLLTHYWSLSVEEQFYFAWPLLVVLAVQAQRRIPRVPLRTVVFILAALVTATSLVLSVRWTGAEGSRAYYLTHLRLWEIGAGALIAMRPRSTARPGKARPYAQAIALAMIGVAAVSYDDFTQFPGSAAALPVMATMALLTVGGRSSRVDAVLSSSPLCYVGERSFAWYLWHWPALGVAVLIDSRFTLGLSDPVRIGGALLISFVVADATHRLVENPIRFAPSLRNIPRITVVVSIAVMIGLISGFGLAERRVVASVAAAWGDAPMTPEAAIEDQASRDFRGCHQGFAQGPESSEVEWCVAGSPTSETTVVLIGDSHAQHWAPAFDAAGREYGWRVLISTRSSCLAYGVPMFNARLEVMDDGCDQWGRAVEAGIAEQGDVDLVVVGRARAYVNTIRDADGARLSESDTALALTAGITSFVERLSTVSRRLVILEDTPWAAYNVPDCLVSETPRTADRCDFEAVTTAPEVKLLRAESAAIAAAPERAAIVSLDQLVCPADWCDVVLPDGLITYRDQHHLTATYSGQLGSSVGIVLREQIAAGADG